MSAAGGLEREHRVLVYAPIGRDGALACEVFARAGIGASSSPDGESFCRELAAGVGAALLAEEALRPRFLAELSRVLGEQPAWSDVPLIVFTRPATDVESILEPLGTLANVVVFERPMRIRPLLSVVRTALRARRRQYETRDLFNRLSEADQRKDEFLAMLGHELRNPLAAIRSAVMLLRIRSPDEVPEPIQVIDRQAGNLQHLLDDLLEVARVVSGKIALRPEVIDLSQVADRARLSLVPRAAERRQDLVADLQPVWVDADPVRMEQVVVNLLHNAVKYTPKGGHITLRLRREDGEAVLTIEDDGVGVDPSLRDSIFEPFRQADASVERAGGGLGLGLPLVRHLVERQGGEVSHRDGPDGRGSVFRVRLPAVSASPEAGRQCAPAPPPAKPARPQRVVLVEDNRDVRETLRDLLRGLGHHVVTASDGPSGLATVEAEHPDVVLVDIGLPGLSGYELASRLRTRHDGGLQLVAITGYGHAEARRRVAEAGFDRHLVKPVDLAALTQLLGRVPAEGSA